MKLGINLFFFQIKAGKAESVFIPIVASIIGTIDITVKAQSVLAADRVKRQLIVEVSRLIEDNSK